MHREALSTQHRTHALRLIWRGFCVRRQLLRVLALTQLLWALPLSLLGLPFWLLARWQQPAQARVQWVGRSGKLVPVLSAYSPSVAWLLKRHPFGAMQAVALGCVVLARDAQALRTCMPHECVHVRQAMRWGPLFPLAYGLASALALWRGGCPYADNVFEREACALTE
jgi:hypothetical protein